MTNDVQHTPNPGWYEDPEAPDLLRWWDGRRWSDVAFRPKPPPAEERANPNAERARTLFFWALGIVSLFWIIPIALTLFPSSELQTVAVILSWIGFLPGLALIVLAIVFGSIGLSRAGKVEGQGRSSALLGLIGGIGLFAAPALLAFIGIGLAIALARH